MVEMDNPPEAERTGEGGTRSSLCQAWSLSGLHTLHQLVPDFNAFQGIFEAGRDLRMEPTKAREDADESQ